MEDKTMMELKNKVCDELDDMSKRISRSTNTSMSDWEKVGELVDIKKNLLKIDMLEDGGYSQAGDWEAMGRGRFGDYSRRYDEGGNSYARRGEHYVRGHYSRARDGMGRYSRDGGEELVEHLDMMLEETDDPRQKEAIKRFKREFEKM